MRRAGIETEIRRGSGGEIVGIADVLEIAARKALDARACPGPERGAQPRRLYEGFGRRQQWPLDVVAPILIARADSLPGALQRRIQTHIARNDRVGRHVVGDLRCGFEKQRQIKFNSRWRDAFADPAIDAHARNVALEARAIAAPKSAHRLGIERQLARRQQAQLLDALERALRLRIEATNRIDVLIEQIDPYRRRRAHRKDVEQRAAQCELTGAAHLADAGVAGLGQA